MKNKNRAASAFGGLYEVTGEMDWRGAPVFQALCRV
jgi:hypothetical protein